MVITRGKSAIDCQILRKNKNLYLSKKGIMQYTFYKNACNSHIHFVVKSAWRSVKLYLLYSAVPYFTGKIQYGTGQA